MQTELERKIAEYFQTIPDTVLAAAVKQRIDFALIARQSLAARGLDHNAIWIGFDAAKALV